MLLLPVCEELLIFLKVKNIDSLLKSARRSLLSYKFVQVVVPFLTLLRLVPIKDLLSPSRVYISYVSLCLQSAT